MNNKFRVFLVSSLISLVLWVIIRLSYPAEVHTNLRARIEINGNSFNQYQIDTVVNVALQGKGMDIFRFYFTRPDTIVIKGGRIPMQSIGDTVLFKVNKPQWQMLLNSVLGPFKVSIGSVLSDSMVFRRITMPIRELPIKIKLKGQLPDGYRIVGNPMVSPPKAKVLMSFSHYKLMDTLFTEGISLSGVTDTIRRSVSLSFVPEQGESLLQKNVFVLIPIAKPEEREIIIPYSIPLIDKTIDVVVNVSMVGKLSSSEVKKEIKVSHTVLSDSIRINLSSTNLIKIINYEPRTVPLP